jgi:delta-aminolevulinic acid dehydratase/porphobilinogen synthase
MNSQNLITNTTSFLNFALNIRPRRNRKSPWIRELLAENDLTPRDLIMPFFVIDGENKTAKLLPTSFPISTIATLIYGRASSII